MTVDRAQFLRLGAVGALGVAGAGLIAARPATAALPAPNPVGDDIGFFGFAVVAELTSQRCCQEALRVKGWPADYAVDFPRGSFDTEAGGALLDRYLTIPSFG